MLERRSMPWGCASGRRQHHVIDEQVAQQHDRRDHGLDSVPEFGEGAGSERIASRSSSLRHTPPYFTALGASLAGWSFPLCRERLRDSQRNRPRARERSVRHHGHDEPRVREMS
jgi:hypothetical protein